MSLNHSPAIVTDGLVLCLDAANVRSYPKSGTTWSDLIGTNDGVMQNMTASNFSSDNGGILSFDGSNERVEIDSAVVSAVPLTLCAWIKRTNSSDNAIFQIHDNSGTSQNAFRMYLTSNNYLNIATRKQDGSIVTGGPITSSSVIGLEFSYVVGVFESGTSATLYVNGEESASGTLSDRLPNSASLNKFFIGDIRAGIWPFAGIINNVSVYNKALTADEIRRNYEATVGRYT